jgi:hypothetical protein
MTVLKKALRDRTLREFWNDTGGVPYGVASAKLM